MENNYHYICLEEAVNRGISLLHKNANNCECCEVIREYIDDLISLLEPEDENET